MAVWPPGTMTQLGAVGWTDQDSRGHSCPICWPCVTLCRHGGGSTALHGDGWTAQGTQIMPRDGGLIVVGGGLAWKSRAWNPEPSGLGTRAPVGLQQLQGFVLLGWWQGLGPGPRSPWLGIQRAGRTPRHRSLGLLCASVDSSSCFSRGSQGPTAPTGQMPASPLAGWPSTLGRAIAQPSLDSDGEGAMARPLKPALV